MGKKVLIIAKVLYQRNSLKEKLDNMVEAVFATIAQNNLPEIMKEFQPEHVVCYLNSMNEAEWKELATLLTANGYLNKELILLGTGEECKEFKECCGLDSCIVIKCPVSLNNFVRSLKSILSFECKEDMGTNVYKSQILVIDDSPVSLKSIKVWLEEAFRVSIVNSGTAALDYLKKKHADLIIMDYAMPGMDGKETLAKLRENPETKEIPVFFLTGVSDNEKAQEVMKLKPQGYFLKTANKEEMLTAIANFLDVL